MKMTLPGSLIKPFIKLHLQSANMYKLTTGEYTVVFELAFPLLLLPIHLNKSYVDTQANNLLIEQNQCALI